MPKVSDIRVELGNTVLIDAFLTIGRNRRMQKVKGMNGEGVGSSYQVRGVNEC